jgi:hypothetical protein
VQGAPTLMQHTAGAVVREQSLMIRRHSAGGAATLTAPVVDGVRARRVRVAGGVAAAVADGAAEVVVAVLAAGGSGHV